MEPHIISTCFICEGMSDVLNLYDTHICEDNEEVYADILKECFDIEVRQESNISGICVNCVMKLRDAYTFKLEIIQAQKMLLDDEIEHFEVEYLEYENSENEDFDEKSFLDPASGLIKIEINGNETNEIKLEKVNKTRNYINVKRVGKKKIENKKQSKNVINVIKVGKEKIKDKKQNECMINNFADDDDDNDEDEDTTSIKSKSRKPPITLDPEQTDCNFCPATFITHKMLVQHIHTHYPNYVCTTCGANFATRRSLTRHFRSHLNGPFYCHICNKEFQKINTLNAHIWRLHSNENPYACAECGERFKTFNRRLKHLQDVHGKIEAKYPCPYCDSKFFYGGSRSKHIRLTHLKERSYQCEYCPMTFAKRSAMKCHQSNIHNIGEKKFKCDVCDKKFFFRSGLNFHMRSHVSAESRYICKICDAKFTNQHVLHNHMEKHEHSDIEDDIEA